MNRICCVILGAVESHVIDGGGAIKQPVMQGVLLLLLPLVMMQITAPMHLIH
jgi:hypothetical protein